MEDIVKNGGTVAGTATCGNCGAKSSQQDVYSGKYDVGHFVPNETKAGISEQHKKWWQFWK